MSGPEPIVVWGAGGHARVVADIIRCDGRFHITGFIDDVDLERRGESFAGATVLGGREQLPALLTRGITAAAVAVGDCDARLRIAALLEAQGLRLPALVHPRATIAGDVELGDGCVVAAGAVVNSGCRLGRVTLINTLASADHECVLEAGVHLGPGAHLGGKCAIGRGAWIGIGAAAIDGIRIGARSVIGAGAVVVREIPEGVVAFGVPARVMRKIDSENRAVE